LRFRLQRHKQLQGKVVGECHQRHRHQEFLKFLRRLDKEFPGDVPLHLIIDNYGTHKHEKVTAWLNDILASFPPVPAG
jgi:transposase